MAMATLTSAHNTNLSLTLPFEKNNISPPAAAGAAFSTFPGGAEENHARKVSESIIRELSTMITNQDEHHYTITKKEEDGEIGVFGAEKYFNGGIDMDSPRITKTDAKNFECSKDGGVNPEPVKPVIHQETPNALLQSAVINPQQAKPSKVNGKSFFSGLVCCKCYCSDSNSVDIEEVQVGEISFKRPAKAAASKAKLDHQAINKPSAENKEDLFTFPTMGIRPVKVPLQGEPDEIGRKSLEVFGSPVLGRRTKSLNLERRLNMLSWNGTPKVEETGNSKGKCNVNDTESDASSDLFEIESITGKANPFLASQASDAASGCVTPTTCYAPSEASIEWSVVTASAANFPVMFDYEEPRPSSITLPSPIKTFSTITNGRTKNNKELQRWRSSGLLDCSSSKAVEVAGDAHRTKDKAGFDPRMRRISDSYMPATRF